MATLTFSPSDSFVRCRGRSVVLTWYTDGALADGKWAFDELPVVTASGGAVVLSEPFVRRGNHRNTSRKYVRIKYTTDRIIDASETFEVENGSGESCGNDGTNDLAEISSATEIRNLSHTDSATGLPEYPLREGCPFITTQNPAGTANLVCDLNPASVAGIDGAGVTSWADSSGHGNGFTSFLTGSATKRVNDPAVNAARTAIELASGTTADFGSLNIDPDTDSYSILYVGTEGIAFQNGGTDANELLAFLDGGNGGVHSVNGDPRMLGRIQLDRALATMGIWDQAATTFVLIVEGVVVMRETGITAAAYASTLRLRASATCKVFRIMIWDAALTETEGCQRTAYESEDKKTRAIRWYADPDNGDDGNDGRSAGSPFETTGGNNTAWLALMTGSGDQWNVEAGTTLSNFDTRASFAGGDFRHEFGHSPEFPGIVGVLERRNNGRAELQLVDGDNINWNTYKKLHMVGFKVTCPDRDPADNANFVGFAALQDATYAVVRDANQHDDIESVFVVRDCDFSNMGGSVLRQINNVHETNTFAYSAILDCVLYNIYDKNTLHSNSVRPSGMYTYGSDNSHVDGILGRYCGFSPFIASICAPGGGTPQPFTSVTATLGGGNTTLSATNLAANFTMPATGTARCLLNSASAGVSNFRGTILSSANANTLVIVGDPFSGQNPTDVTVINTDPDGAGGAGRNGLCHQHYFSGPGDDNSNYGMVTQERVVGMDPGDHFAQLRCGGELAYCFVHNAPQFGFVDQEYGRVYRCHANGAARTWGDFFSGLRGYGPRLHEANGTVNSIEYCILSIGDEGTAQWCDPDGTCIEVEESASQLEQAVHHNTVYGHPARAIRVGSTSSVGEVYRNIFMQPALGYSGTPLLTSVGAGASGRTWGPHNLWHHEDGSSANVFDNNGSVIAHAAWVTAMSELNSHFSVSAVTFANRAKGNLAGYEESLGGSASYDDFFNNARAQLAATGLWGDYDPREGIWPWIEACWTPTNLVLADFDGAPIGATGWTESSGGAIPRRGWANGRPVIGTSGVRVF